MVDEQGVAMRQLSGQLKSRLKDNGEIAYCLLLLEMAQRAPKSLLLATIKT